MKLDWKYKALLYKRYFDKGYSITSPVKYLIIGMGIKLDPKDLGIIGAIYFISCFILGAIWFEKGIVELEEEIGHQYDPLSKELRTQMKKKKL